MTDDKQPSRRVKIGPQTVVILGGWRVTLPPGMRATSIEIESPPGCRPMAITDRRGESKDEAKT